MSDDKKSDDKKTSAPKTIEEIVAAVRAKASESDDCTHCFHPFMGAIWMVIPGGHVVMQCCHCGSTKTQHAAHVAEKTWRTMRGAGGFLANR